MHLVCILVGLTVLATYISVERSNFSYRVSVDAHTAIHATMVHALARARTAFFDHVPAGQIVSTLSGDMSMMDKNIRHNFNLLFTLISSYGTGLIYVCVLYPHFLLPLVPLLWLLFQN